MPEQYICTPDETEQFLSRASRLLLGGTQSNFPFDQDVFLFSRGSTDRHLKEGTLNGIIYLVGLIVIILAILSFFGLR